MEFLIQDNWPSLGQGNHSEASKKLHDWCGKISQYVVSLSERVKQLESNQTRNLNEISSLKSQLEASNNSAKASNISSEWVQIVTKGSKNAKKPPEQLVVTNAAISELNEREKRKKNVIIYGVPESSKEVLTEKRAEDEQIIKGVLDSIGKSEIKPVYSRRLRSKDASKPGPILVELSDASLRNPVLLAARNLRSNENYKTVYISPDLTEAERQLDYKLRQERNKLNSNLSADSPFRYGIRGNQIQRFKKNI
jgi:hypothetical protein